MWITLTLASSSAFEEADKKQIQEKNKSNSEDAVCNEWVLCSASANEAEWLPFCNSLDSNRNCFSGLM
jgi:hypothetical protein